MNGKILKGREGNSLSQFYRRETEKLFSPNFFFLLDHHISKHKRSRHYAVPMRTKMRDPGTRHGSVLYLMS